MASQEELSYMELVSCLFGDAVDDSDYVASNFKAHFPRTLI
jgi:hypothetical protein